MKSGIPTPLKEDPLHAMSNEATNSPANWTLQREEEETIKLMNILYDLLDSGKSFEDLKIDLDIGAAGGAISERLREVSHQALEIIKEARDAGADRNKVITCMQQTVKGIVRASGGNLSE